LRAENIPRHIQANWFALFVKAIFVIALWVGWMWLAAFMRCTPNSALVDRVDFATLLSMSSRSVTGLSALAPAQQAGAQRLCALAQLGPPVMSAFLPLLGTSGHGASLHPSALI
jgi:hypothetical protein